MKTIRTGTLRAIFSQLVFASPTVIGLGLSACSTNSTTTSLPEDADAAPADGRAADAGPADAAPVDANFYCVLQDASTAGPPSCQTCYARLAELPDANAYADAPLSPDGGPASASPEGIPCTALCGGRYFSCAILDASLPASVVCQPDCTGRRPEGLRPSAVAAESAAGAYFATMAQLEAASVPAFRRMARELAQFRAPRKLVRLAQRAARDEVRHARAARGLARRFGGASASFEVAAHAPRSLESFAIENAVEGCVRETYGALEATWQARTAGDPRVRAQMTRIARDETAHATLAFQVDAWLRGRLQPAARARVDAARASARTELHERLAKRNVDASVAYAVGVPAAATALRLAQGLEARLEMGR